MALESIDLFDSAKDIYLQYLRSHPDDLALTLRMVKDMDCTLRERVDQQFSDQKKTALSPFFDSTPGPLHYAKTLVAMVKALEEPIVPTKPEWTGPRPKRMPELFKMCYVSDGALKCPPP